MKTRLLLIVCLICTITLAAEDKLDERSDKTEKALSPYALYTPETGFSLGLLGIINTHNLWQAEDNARIVSSIQYTQKRQMILNLNPEYKTGEKEFQTDLNIGYKYWPDQFYGIGIDSQEAF